MNVLLINPNLYSQHLPPIGLEYIASSLLRENIDFDAVDLNYESEKTIYRKLQEKNVDIVGFTVRIMDSCTMPGNEFFLPFIKKLVGRIKNSRDCKVVLGGAGFSSLPQPIVEYTGADFGVVGYGEEAMPKLVRAIREGGDFSKIDNLLWRKNGKFQQNTLSMGNYKNLPARRRNIFRNLSYYRAFGWSNVEESRGCPKLCGYCAEPGLAGRKVVERDIAGLIEEMKELKSLGIKHTYLVSCELNVGSLENSYKLCEELIKSKVGMTWSCSIDPDPKTTPQKLLNLMSEAGCSEVIISAESGSNVILEGMEKSFTVEECAVCVENLRKANIGIIPGFVIGWPGESTETIKETFDFIKRVRFKNAAVFAGVRIYPHTKIARIAKEEGLIETEADLITPLFYQSERVLKEFRPFMVRQLKFVTEGNIMYPYRAINFLNLLLKNVYLNGLTGKGLAPIFAHVKSLSKLTLLKLFGKTVVQYIIPPLHRYIPIAKGDIPRS